MNYDKIAFHNFQEGLKILAQVIEDQQVSGPQVIIEPLEPAIQRAVSVLTRMDPMYFSGVKKIVASPGGGNYGFVESGPNKDPTVININVSRIKSESASSSFSDIVISAAIVIAHERGHVKSFDSQQGFIGGEAPAEAEENRVSQWIQNNLEKIKDLLV